MKRYYIIHGDFRNQYKLFYAENTADELELIASGAINIPRIDAIRYAREERNRRKDDPAFAYYADDRIYPLNTRYNPAHKTDYTGYIVLQEV